MTISEKINLQLFGANDTVHSTEGFVNANTGTLVFMNKLMSILLTERLSSLKNEVEVDKERYAAISIKDIGANFYY